MLPQFRKNPVGLARVLGAPSPWMPMSRVRARFNTSGLKNGSSLAGATLPAYSVAALAAAGLGTYFVRATDGVGSANSAPAWIMLGSASHASLENGYAPGAFVTINSSAVFSGGPTALKWQTLLPPGWSYVSDNLAGVAARPASASRICWNGRGPLSQPVRWRSATS